MAKAARHPIYECRVNGNWQESLLATVIVARKRADNMLAVAIFLVDLGCLGIKNAIANTKMTRSGYHELQSRLLRDRNPMQCTPELAARIVEEGLNYAKVLGFQPHKDYWAACPILADIAIDQETPVTCGSKGKPLYVSGPHDDVPNIMHHLEQHVGPNGFHYIAGPS